MSRFMDKKYVSLEEYVPGEQPKDMQYIKLNTNESPFPPSPKVLEAINSDEINKLELYPDPVCTGLTKRLAETYGVESENVFIGNGSDEVLNFSFMAFCEDGAAFADITYGFYQVFADLYNIDAKVIPLRADFSIGVEDYLNLNRCIFIANPNAPTGLVLPLDCIRKIIESNKDHVVIIDEAYIDFGGESCVQLVNEYDNLLVVQTYSKSRSLAGGRLGYAIGNAELIADLTKIIENRRYTTTELVKLGFEVLASCSNFVFARTDRMEGGELYLKLKAKGILVRHFDKERIKDYLRITIGTKEQMTALINTLETIFKEENR